jgi:predicted transcriptional regulator
LRRISKQREREKKILDILENGRATFETILEKVECGRATLSKDLKLLVKRGIIKKYEDPEDSRKNWYEKKGVGPHDRIKAEKGKYASTEFIESLETPVYWVTTSKNKKTSISVFMSPVEEQYREAALKETRRIAESYLWVLRGMGEKMFPGKKIAVVIALEG